MTALDAINLLLAFLVIGIFVGTLTALLLVARPR